MLALLLDRRVAVLLAVPALVWVWSYATALVPSAGVGPADLRVATYNTYVGAPGAGHVVGLAEAEQPDVLLLQELFPPRAAALRRRLERQYPYVHVANTDGVGGVGVFSRHPIVDVRHLEHTTARSRNGAVVVLEVAGRRLQVASVHLLSPCPGCGPSPLARSRTEIDTRRAEIRALLEALDPSLPAVVGGDLNSTERSEPYRRLVAAGFDDPHRAAGAGLGFTWPAHRGPGPLLRIDWVLTRGLEAGRAWVGSARTSDHRPVIVDLRWSPLVSTSRAESNTVGIRPRR